MVLKFHILKLVPQTFENLNLTQRLKYYTRPCKYDQFKF